MPLFRAQLKVALVGSPLADDFRSEASFLHRSQLNSRAKAYGKSIVGMRKELTGDAITGSEDDLLDSEFANSVFSSFGCGFAAL